MAGKSTKKERHQRKRQQKRHHSARLTGGSPYRQIGRSGELVACYINEGWRERGCATIFVVRRSRDRGMVVASFYVDLWCAGLKDAWGRFGVKMEEFDRWIHNGLPDETKLIRTDYDVVAGIIAGGIRFAERNGFRLPSHYQRWLAILGDVGDPASADLSDFGVGEEKNLRYIGTWTDLEQRLVGCSVNEFLRRPDVDFIVDEDDLGSSDDDEVAIEEARSVLREALINKVRHWYIARDIPPSPCLPEAMDVLMTSLRSDDSPHEGAPDDRLHDGDAPSIDDVCREAMARHQERLIEMYGARGETELQMAMAQVAVFVNQFETPGAMLATLGLTEIDGDEPF
ncbi:MAG: hypothetical protein ACE5F9_09725 [Phycisphaerae bacterium]